MAMYKLNYVICAVTCVLLCQLVTYTIQVPTTQTRQKRQSNQEIEIDNRFWDGRSPNIFGQGEQGNKGNQGSQSSQSNQGDQSLQINQGNQDNQSPQDNQSNQDNQSPQDNQSNQDNQSQIDQEQGGAPNSNQENNPDSQQSTQNQQQIPFPSSTVDPNCEKNVCLSTSEFNPVCGNNNRTYTNIGKLECASFCGVAVQFKRHGNC